MQVFVRAKFCPDPCKRGRSVQVWNLKKAGQVFDWHGSIFVQTRVKTRNRATFCSDSVVMEWNQMPQLV